MRTHPHSLRGSPVLAGFLLGIFLALHAAAMFPTAHAFWHAHESDGHDHHGHAGECQEPDCVVLALAHGKLDAGVVILPVVRPDFPALRDVRIPGPSHSWARPRLLPAERAPPA